MPPGTLVWTPEREALLVEVLAALGKLDSRLLDLFSGDVKQLASKIDAAQIDPSRLLAAPVEPGTKNKPAKSALAQALDHGLPSKRRDPSRKATR